MSTKIVFARSVAEALEKHLVFQCPSLYWATATGHVRAAQRRFVRDQPAQLLLSMNRCCEKAVPLGKATCPDCEEASAGYQAAMTSTETPPWE